MHIGQKRSFTEYSDLQREYQDLQERLDMIKDEVARRGTVFVFLSVKLCFRHSIRFSAK